MPQAIWRMRVASYRSAVKIHTSAALHPRKDGSIPVMSKLLGEPWWRSEHVCMEKSLFCLGIEPVPSCIAVQSHD
jgi:hypothetical protein